MPRRAWLRIRRWCRARRHRKRHPLHIEYWVQDASAASENLLLAAQALGLGAVWTGVYPIDERVKEVQKILQLPEQIVPLNVIPIGYPAENPLPKDKWKPENVHYDRWTKPDKK